MPLPLIPIIITFGAAGLIASRRKPKPKQVTSGRNMSRTYLDELGKYLRSGREPSEKLIQCAIYEALQQGRDDVADAIVEKFYPDTEETDDEDEETPTSEEKPTEDQADTITVSGKSSPIAGVSNEHWETFVSKLATKPADFATDRYVGKYHLRKDRVKELGFDLINAPDDETQYAMLCADLVDAKERAAKLIADHLASIVVIDGVEHGVTLSGILGVLKAAGSTNAESWFGGDRFKETTAVFLATNGVF